MKKIYLIVIGILAILGIFAAVFRGFSGEDDWIKDGRGVWVKHGAPAETPDEVLEQQRIIGEASQLYNSKKSEGIEFSSQCLGTSGDYAVDIVHAPRSVEDNLIENQCEDYRNGNVKHFIELDKNGEIVRIN